MKQPEPLVDAEIVARHLGFSPVTIRRMAAAGKIRCHIYGLGERTFYRARLSEVDSPYTPDKSEVAPRKKKSR